MADEVKTDVLKATGIVVGSAGMGYVAGKGTQQLAVNRVAGERAAINTEIQTLLNANEGLGEELNSLNHKYQNMKWPDLPVRSYKDDWVFENSGPQTRVEAAYEKANKLKRNWFEGLKGAEYKALENAFRGKADASTLSPELKSRYNAYLKYQNAKTVAREFETARMDVINCEKIISSNSNKVAQLRAKLPEITKQCAKKGTIAGIFTAIAFGSVAAIYLFAGNSKS